jgi:ribosomal protein L13E
LSKSAKRPSSGAPTKGAEGIHPRPKGKAPEAVVEARHGTGMTWREGRGFSLGELTGAGLGTKQARGWGVRVDDRRRSVVEWNVEAHKGWGSKRQVSKASTRLRKAEEEIVEAAEEVEEEVKVVEEEVVKAGKKAKKEVSKAEAAVKAKVGRPRTKAKKKTDS